MSEYVRPDLSMFGEEHVRRYRETDGEVGYEWNGVPTLLLTTTGRTTAQPRTVALIFGRDGDRCIVIASKGGAPEHPLWYRNFEREPECAGADQGGTVHGERSHGRRRRT